MIAVADTTPLNYLVLIGHAAILPQLFGQIAIPSGVFDELQRSRTPEPVRSWIAEPPAWLKVELVREAQIGGLEHLGAGERGAILLAEAARADWLIMDDSDGRHEAARRGLPVIGTLRVLDEAANRGLIDLPAAIHRLKQTTFYLSPKLLRWLMDRHAQRVKKL